VVIRAGIEPIVIDLVAVVRMRRSLRSFFLVSSARVLRANFTRFGQATLDLLT
jgi:hypothetical protein